MATRKDVDELRRLVLSNLRDRLRPAGWEVLPARDSNFEFAAFRHGLGAEFAAIAEVGTPAHLFGRPSFLITGVRVGISYEPLRELSPLLGLFDQPLVRESVWPPQDAPPEGHARHERSLTVRTIDDVEQAGETISAAIIEHGVSFADRHADPDGLLTRFSEGDEERDRLACAALLTAAGRFDQAKLSLAALADIQPDLRNREDRRAAYQLRRWIDSGGDRSLIPAAMPPRRGAREREFSLSRSWGEGRAMNAALVEFREQATGKTREQARVILQDTLRRHRREENGPIWIEDQLDRLQESREERWRSGAETLWRVGRGAVKAIRERALPDLLPPSLLEPPDHALYQIPATTSSTAVALDPEAEDRLSSAYQASPHILGLVRFTVWLRQTTRSAEQPAAVEVFLGETRIGTIASHAQHDYAQILADAAERDEHPCLDATLAVRGDDFLMQIDKPAQNH